ncbi:hypothetical protein UAW_03012 [Enterococcus haemoperoxidus ATCC BAA-382]|uniref:Uncharacterized protein n=1 Tax=Enterococcus haemoperoxidus ATCC BAA-382 TaxID=1158608 RepID=R2Q7L7_9ENTE|nr:DUF916 and DUF3324 domain-containing protein [Enterococcus haemoperoxidus]EOH92492.1 hypothetical protein UAW_03012 [Enterococcus haemoperoxidus ATCC BAA-382]EOT61713.1 hypothetical protein I583_00695 [Enterococcus haemoperoxidus ATCC BAA-382]OJG51821.1 hypothetical protein RV06_GL001513 [Enterococcus haemoperoxidus]
MKNVKKNLYNLLFILLFLICPIQSQAADMEYSVSADIPENQVDKSQTYFDLRMKPEQKQELTLKVSNSGDKEITLNIIPNSATTNQNGVVDFSEKDRKIDSSLSCPITKLISGEQKVKLAPKEKKAVKFTLQMPKEEIDGKIVGGFYVYKDEANDEQKSSEGGVQISNKYAMVVGIQLTEKDDPVKAELNLNAIQPDLINYRTAVTANIQNTKPTFVNDLKVVAKVSKKDSVEIIHQTTKEEMAMAPNSNFDFPISWDNQELLPGKYTLDLVATTKEDEWAFKKEFEITSKEAKKLTDEAIEIEKEPNYWAIGGIIAASILVVVGIIILVVLLYKKRKKKLELERKRQAKKRKQQRKKRTEKDKQKDRYKQ